jgi:translation elongation factor EF-G
MREDYPIERHCSHPGEPFQLKFARNAMQILPQDEETAFKPGPRGLLILAETEMALERAAKRLADVYGDDVRIGPPTVRYRQGAHTEEPHMGLRVLCAPEQFEAVRQDLCMRQAAILDAEVNRHFGIVRARAPLAALLGYPGRLAQLTRGHGQLVMWLSHYEALEDPPPAGSAA